MRPDLREMMPTELPAENCGCREDIAIFYLDTPFGWGGSPANLAQFGDEVTMARLPFGLSRPDRRGALDLLSELYVEDGIFTEWAIPERPTTSTAAYETMAGGTSGGISVNESKMSEAGHWSREQIVFGFITDAHLFPVCLPGGEIAWARFPMRYVGDIIGLKWLRSTCSNNRGATLNVAEPRILRVGFTWPNRITPGIWR